MGRTVTSQTQSGKPVTRGQKIEALGSLRNHDGDAEDNVD